MYVLLNKCYGGFNFSDEVLEFIKERDNYDSIYDIVEEDYRDDDDIIDLYNQYGSERISGSHSKLCMFAIPKNATDYAYEEYDGYENVVYVVDGKLHWL